MKFTCSFFFSSFHTLTLLIVESSRLYSIQKTKYRSLNTDHWIQIMEYRSLNTDHWIQIIEYRSLNSDHGIQIMEYRSLNTDRWIQIIRFKDIRSSYLFLCGWPCIKYLIRPGEGATQTSKERKIVNLGLFSI